MDSIFISTIALGGVGALAALLLYVVSRRFAVKEDGRIGEVESLLPGANCGACGFNGCHDFAVRCVTRGSVDGMLCPGAGAENMKRISGIFGGGEVTAVARVAVLKCAGDCARRHAMADYDGPSVCAIVNRVGAGSLSCAYGCIGCGDCVDACRFGALRIDEDSRLPVVDESACTGCGVCVSRCPRHLMELRPAGVKGRRVWVACSNKERGAVARRGCTAACIGCGKCAKACPFGAIEVSGNLAYVDASKCRLCRKCVGVCPTGVIHAVNFPVPVNRETEVLK